MSWVGVHCAIGMAVAWGRIRLPSEGIMTIGVDDIACQSRHRYLMLVYQLDADRQRLLWVSQEHNITTLESFFTWFRKLRSARLRVVCSDMWQAYLRAVRDCVSRRWPIGSSSASAGVRFARGSSPGGRWTGCCARTGRALSSGAVEGINYKA